jgi:hypothetical protein
MHRSPTSPLQVKIPKLLRPKSKNKHKPETNLSPRDNGLRVVLVEEGPTLLPMALSTMTQLLKRHKETAPTVAAEAAEVNPRVVTSILRRALKPKAKVEDVAVEDKEEVKEDKEERKDKRKVLRPRTKMLLVTHNKRLLIKYKTPNPKPLNNPPQDQTKVERREANKLRAKNQPKDKINPPRLSLRRPKDKRESKLKSKVNKRPRAKSKDNRLRDNKLKDNKPKESKDRPRDNKLKGKSKVTSKEAPLKNKGAQQQHQQQPKQNGATSVQIMVQQDGETIHTASLPFDIYLLKVRPLLN